MDSSPNHFDYLTDDEAMAFIRLMSKELLSIAIRRNFLALIPALLSTVANSGQTKPEVNEVDYKPAR